MMCQVCEYKNIRPDESLQEWGLLVKKYTTFYGCYGIKPSELYVVECERMNIGFIVNQNAKHNVQVFSSSDNGMRYEVKYDERLDKFHVSKVRDVRNEPIQLGEFVLGNQ